MNIYDDKQLLVLIFVVLSLFYGVLVIFVASTGNLQIATYLAVSYPLLFGLVYIVTDLVLGAKAKSDNFFGNLWAGFAFTLNAGCLVPIIIGFYALFLTMFVTTTFGDGNDLIKSPKSASRLELIEQAGFVFEDQHGLASVEGRYPDNRYSEAFFVYKMVSPAGQISDSYYRSVMKYVPSHDELCNSEEEIGLRKSTVSQDITFLNKELIGLKSTLDVQCYGKKHNDIYEDYIKLKISDDVVKLEPEDMFFNMVDWPKELYMLAANNFENENSDMLAQDLRLALLAIHEREDEHKVIKF